MNDMFRPPAMTARERETLVKIMRQRERVAKAEAVQYGAQLKLEFEKQLDREYSWDEDAVWAEAIKVAKEVAAEAAEKVQKRCDELGIRRDCQPSVQGPHWARRGRNAIKAERAEMRRIADAEIDARVKKAQAEIARASVAAQERVLVTGLTSGEAKEMLESLPAVTALVLLPSIDSVAKLFEDDYAANPHKYYYLDRG